MYREEYILKKISYFRSLYIEKLINIWFSVKEYLDNNANIALITRTKMFEENVPFN